MRKRFYSVKLTDQFFKVTLLTEEELQRQERTPTSDRKKDVQVKTDIIVKSVMTKKPAKISSTKCWSAIKAVGFGVKAVLEEKSDVRDGRQRSISQLNNSLSGAETVDVINGSQNFDCDGEMRIMRKRFYSVKLTDQFFKVTLLTEEELQRQERTPTSDRKKDVQVKTDIIVKSVMTKKPAKISSTKCWSAIKAVGFGVKAVLEEKSDVRDGRQRSISQLNNSLSGAETVDVINGSQNFDCDGEMDKQITTKPKSEGEQFKKMMDRCIARWDIGKKMTVRELKSEAHEEVANSRLEDHATLSDDDFSDDDSFFDSDDEDRFECMDNDVFLLSFCERQSNSFASTPKNELRVGKKCSKSLIPHDQIISGLCMPWYFGKWIDAGETAMPHFNFANRDDLATAAENIFGGILIANNSRHGIVSTGCQHTDQLSLTRTSEDNCEKLQGSFVLFPTDGADSEATKNCGSKAAKANTDGFLEESKEEKSTTPAKSGENYFSKIWKENEVDEKGKFENEDSKSSVTAVGSGNTIEEEITSFGTSLQLVPVIFRKLDNQSFDAEIAAAGETVIYDVCDQSTAEELVKSDAFIDGQDGSSDGSGDVVCGLVQMKLEEPDRKKKCSLNSEAQLPH